MGVWIVSQVCVYNCSGRCVCVDNRVGVWIVRCSDLQSLLSSYFECAAKMMSTLVSDETIIQTEDSGAFSLDAQRVNATQSEINAFDVVKFSKTISTHTNTHTLTHTHTHT